MKTTLIPLLSTLAGLFRSRARLHLEVLALRQQLAVVTYRDQQRVTDEVFGSDRVMESKMAHNLANLVIWDWRVAVDLYIGSIPGMSAHTYTERIRL